MFVQRKYYPDTAFYYEGGDGREVTSQVQSQGGTTSLKVYGSNYQLSINIHGQKATLMPGYVMILRQDSSPLVLHFDDFISKYEIIGDTYVDPDVFKEQIGDTLHNLTSEVEEVRFILNTAHRYADKTNDKVKKLISQQEEFFEALNDATQSLVDHFKEAYEGPKKFGEKIVVNTSELLGASTLVEKIRDSLKDLEAARKDFMTGIDVEALQKRLGRISKRLDSFDAAIHALSLDNVEALRTHLQEQDKEIKTLQDQVKSLAGRVGVLDKNTDKPQKQPETEPKEAPAEEEPEDEPADKPAAEEPAEEESEDEPDSGSEPRTYSRLTKEQAQALVDAWKTSAPDLKTTVARVLKDKSPITVEDLKILREKGLTGNKEQE